MIEYVQSIWTLFDPEAFGIGLASIISYWFAGWTIGLICDVIRKS